MLRMNDVGRIHPGLQRVVVVLILILQKAMVVKELMYEQVERGVESPKR